MSNYNAAPTGTRVRHAPPGQVIAAGLLVVLGGVLLGVPLIALGGAAIFVVGLVAKGVEIGTATRAAAPERPVKARRSDGLETVSIGLAVSGFVIMLAALAAEDLNQGIAAVAAGAGVAIVGLCLWIFRR